MAFIRLHKLQCVCVCCVGIFDVPEHVRLLRMPTANIYSYRIQLQAKYIYFARMLFSSIWLTLKSESKRIHTASLEWVSNSSQCSAQSRRCSDVAIWLLFLYFCFWFEFDVIPTATMGTRQPLASFESKANIGVDAAMHVVIESLFDCFSANVYLCVCAAVAAERTIDRIE